MTERRSFDPVGRFFSAACFFLLAALAINVAVTLLLDVWLWLVGLLAAVAVVVVLVRLALWWQRRRLW